SFLFFIFAFFDKHSQYKKMLYFLFGLSLIFYILDIFGFVSLGVSSKFFGRFYTDGGPLFTLFIIEYFLVATYAHIFGFLNYKTLKNEEKQRLRLVFFGSITGFLGGGTTVFPVYNLGIYPFGLPLVVLYTVLVSYTITKHELMDIQVVIKRKLAYVIVGTLLIISYLLLNFSPIPATMMLNASIALAIFWAFAAHRLRAFIQTPLEEKWITEWYDTEKLISSVTEKLIPVYKRKDVFITIAQELKNRIKIEKIEIELNLEVKDKIKSFIVAKDKKGVILPLSSSKGFEGQLILGTKISEQTYNQKDLVLFKTLMNQAYLVLDRIRPYEEVKTEFSAAQQKLIEIAASVTHEIRNPLTVIRAKTDSLSEKASRQTIIEYKTRVLEYCDRINTIISSVLSLTKGEKKAVVKVAVDLNQVIDSALEGRGLENIQLEKELGNLPNIIGGPEELRQVFVNLIDNAIQAMAGQGKLKIKTYQSEANLVAEIIDSGPGITKNDQTKIFDKFYTTKKEGTGVGLAMVSSIVKRYNGEIKVESEIGKGTTFALRFPNKDNKLYEKH
ncbi:GHKL domain-containing protein, partial [bacterium]|nr:GHKL domain-containing protein [bacterium]